MMVTRRCITGLVALFATVGLGAMAVAGALRVEEPSLAETERRSIYANQQGVALHGFDPVAYFIEGEARRGSPAFQHDHAGATFHFESQENLDRFAAAPSRYLPEFGGFSVFGMALGKTYETDPRVFDLIDGRLYLSRNEKVRDLWQANKAGYIARAEQVWAGEGQ